MKTTLSTYLQYGQRQVGRIQKIALPSETLPPDLVFEVVEGPQSGSKSVVQDHQVKIGSHWESDLFLAGIEDGKEISLTSYNSVMGTLVEVETDLEGLTLDGELIEHKAHPRRLPAELRYRDDAISISSVDTFLQQEERQNPDVNWIFAALGAFVFLSMLLIFEVFRTTGSAVALNSTQPVAETHASISETAETIVRGSPLAKQVDIKVSPNQPIRVEATLTQKQLAAWQSLRTELDSAVGTASVMYRIERKNPLNDVPAIGLINFGRDAFVQLRDGRRVVVGEQLMQGWELTEISRDAVILSNGIEAINVAFRAK